MSDLVGRRGVVLLEAIVALALAVAAGTTVVPLVASATRAVSAASAMDERREAAERYLLAISMWTRNELDARAGARRNGGWLVDVRIEPDGRYRVRVTAGDLPQLWMETVLDRSLEGR